MTKELWCNQCVNCKGKKEKNNDELMRAYEDAIYYSSTTDKKLMYSDSSIAVATKTLNNDFISRAYLVKGTIYYFNLKNTNLL